MCILQAFPIGAKEGTLKNRLKEMKNFKVIAKKWIYDRS